MDLGLTDKKAFVGGGSRGIGKAIALDLAREGVDVVIASRNMDELEKTAREIEDATGRKIIAMALDVTKRDQVDRVMAEAAEKLGGLHILVNSASLPGGSPNATGPIDSVVDEDLIEALDGGHLAAATLDVFHAEPLPDDHPFWAHPKITVTPHMASRTAPATAAKAVAENIRRMENGEPPEPIVEMTLGY